MTSGPATYNWEWVVAVLEDRLRHINESCNSHYTNHMTGVVRGTVWACTGTDPGAADALEAAKALVQEINVRGKAAQSEPKREWRSLEDWELGPTAYAGGRAVSSVRELDVAISYLQHQLRELQDEVRQRT